MPWNYHQDYIKIKIEELECSPTFGHALNHSFKETCSKESNGDFMAQLCQKFSDFDATVQADSASQEIGQHLPFLCYSISFTATSSCSNPLFGWVFLCRVRGESDRMTRLGGFSRWLLSRCFIATSKIGQHYLAEFSWQWLFYTILKQCMYGRYTSFRALGSAHLFFVPDGIDGPPCSMYPRGISNPHGVGPGDDWTMDLQANPVAGWWKW